MGFTLFKDTGRRINNNCIAINKTGTFGFLSGWCDKTSILKNDYVVLAFDETKSQIGFIFLKDSSVGGALKLSKNPKKNPTSASVKSLPFLTRINLDPKKVSGRYSVEEQFNKELNKPMFVIDLKEGKL